MRKLVVVSEFKLTRRVQPEFSQQAALGKRSHNVIKMFLLEKGITSCWYTDEEVGESMYLSFSLTRHCCFTLLRGTAHIS
jgi:hypothetical protein